MALSNKDHMPNDSAVAIIQASAFYDHNFGGASLFCASSNYGIGEHQKSVCEDPESPEKACGLAPKNFTLSNSSSVSSPSSTNSNGLGHNLSAEEAHSVISFKPAAEYRNIIYANGSLLSFDQTKRVPRNLYPKMMGTEEDHEYLAWEDDLHHSLNVYQTQLTNSKSNYGLPETNSSTHYGSPSSGSMQFADGIQEPGRQEASNNKRPSAGENVQALKKQCFVASRRPKPKSASPSKDPQSIAAKNRRERISERLKILQDLVPNGSKVDLVTMLEKAISYVKFLQLQVKVLATDEFWPAQGRKAPDLSQVREAIDAILASQRDRNSSSK